MTEFLKILFEKPSEWSKVSTHDKQRFFFMTQRILSSAYPIQAQSFNLIGVNQADVMDFWQSQLTRIYKRRPDWLWGWTSKSKKEKAAKLPSEEATARYLELTEMSRRDLLDSVSVFGFEETYAPIFRLQKTMDEVI